MSNKIHKMYKCNDCGSQDCIYIMSLTPVFNWIHEALSDFVAFGQSLHPSVNKEQSNIHDDNKDEKDCNGMDN